MGLSLHRVGRAADWVAVPPGERNVWQRVAYHTRGVVTPGNVVTGIGLGLALWGLTALVARQFWAAIVLLVVGRLLDIVDGFVADRTGTKSALGEFLDASIDKVVTLLTVVGLFLAQVAPTWLLGLFVLPHIIIVVIAAADRARGRTLHPSRLGKTTMLLAWVTISLLLLVRALGLPGSHPLVVFVLLFTLVSTAFGFITAHSYVTDGEPVSG